MRGFLVEDGVCVRARARAEASEAHSNIFIMTLG